MGNHPSLLPGEAHLESERIWEDQFESQLAYADYTVCRRVLDDIRMSGDSKLMHYEVQARSKLV